MSSGVRECFEAATEVFAGVVATVGGDQWERPGLGEWTVRDLVGHGSRSLTTIETYLAAARSSGSPVAITIDDPVDYLRWVRRVTTTGDPGAIAQRGRDAGAALGPDPAAAIRPLADRVLPLVAATPDEAPVALPIGGATLRTYLPTRTFELTVHALDLLGALDDRFEAEIEVPPGLAEPMAACLRLAAAVAAAGQGHDAAALLLAVTGRRPLPAGFSVI